MPSRRASLARSPTLSKSALQALGSIPVVHANAPDAGRNVAVDTFLRFEGSSGVIELSDPHVTHSATRTHIALTPATVIAL